MSEKDGQSTKKRKVVKVFKQARKKAKDGQFRHIIVCAAVRENYPFLNIGICISTTDHYDKDRGRDIAFDRAMLRRKSLREKGLRKSIIMNSNWLMENKKVIHLLAEYFLEQTLYNLNDIIWSRDE